MILMGLHVLTKFEATVLLIGECEPCYNGLHTEVAGDRVAKRIEPEYKEIYELHNDASS